MLADKRSIQLTLFACAAGVSIHLYTAAFKAEGGVSGFLVGLVLLSSLPYAIAGALTRLAWARPFALGAALACLLADCYMHYSVFIAPKGSTAAVGLVFLPVWNLLLLGPVGAVLYWLIQRLVTSAKRTN